jgi:hypothetical protein
VGRKALAVPAVAGVAARKINLRFVVSDVANGARLGFPLALFVFHHRC